MKYHEVLILLKARRIEQVRSGTAKEKTMDDITACVSIQLISHQSVHVLLALNFLTPRISKQYTGVLGFSRCRLYAPAENCSNPRALLNPPCRSRDRTSRYPALLNNVVLLLVQEKLE